MEFLKKTFKIAGNNLIIILLSIFFFFSSLLELVSLALIIPYISFVIFPEKTFAFSSYFSFLSNDRIELIYYLSLIIIFVFLLKFVLAIFLNYSVLQISHTIVHKLRMRLIKSFQNIEYLYYLKKNSSFYIECVGSWTMKFGNQILLSVLKIFNDGLTLLFIIIFLSFQNFKLLVIISFVLFILIFLYFFIFKNIIEKIGKNLTLINQRLVQFINEAFLGFKDIKLYGKNKFIYDSIFKLSFKSKNLMVTKILITSLNRYFFEMIIVILFASFILIKIIGQKNLDYDLGIMLTFAIAILRMLPLANSILNSSLNLKNQSFVIDNLYRQLNKINSTKLAKREEKRVIKFEKFKSLELKNIYYKYDKKSSFNINNVSLKIKEGDCVAIVGESGSGKTTLLNIILGLLKPIKGEILFNNIKQNDIIEILNKNIGYVPQEIFMMDDTIIKNITLEDNLNKFKLEQVKKIIKILRLEPLIKSSKKGLNTKIGQSGIRISGGQRQRLSLARSLYSKKKIIIFDEATNALDDKTEREIYKELQSLSKYYTFIVITHKKENLDFFNKIILMRRGKITNIKNV